MIAHRGATTLIASALLSACSDRSPAPSTNQVAAPIGSTPVGSSQSPIGTTGGLNADVSSLTADTSGLSVRVTDTATIIDLPTDTLFAFDSADLSPEASGNLGKVADAIRKGGPGDIAIVGHTDGKGSDAYNQPLSERRAQAVADWMKQQVGVRQRNFAVSGKGKTAPIAQNTHPDGSDDPAGRAKNRRVEVVIPKAA